MPSETSEFVEKLRGAIKGNGLPKGMLCDAIEDAANRIEALERRLIEAEAVAGHVQKRAADKPTHRLGTGQRRLYIVQARDYMGGTIAPCRIANAASLAAMVERCVDDIMGKDANSIRGDGARPDAWVTISACDMEVSDE